MKGDLRSDPSKGIPCVHSPCSLSMPQTCSLSCRCLLRHGLQVSEVDADEDEVLEGVTLEGLPEAVRRGRRIKCTECGQKGATIGCFTRGCRRSYHLQCACVAGCLIKVCCGRQCQPEETACVSWIGVFAVRLTEPLCLRGDGGEDGKWGAVGAQEHAWRGRDMPMAAIGWDHGPGGGGGGGGGRAW